jgi:hypothetical protein
MARGKDKKQINVIMPIEEADMLRTLADKQERSVSQMAAILIREGLEKAGFKTAASTNEENAA